MRGDLKTSHDEVREQVQFTCKSQLLKVLTGRRQYGRRSINIS